MNLAIGYEKLTADEKKNLGQVSAATSSAFELVVHLLLS
jgi:hypothetical protein